MQVTPDGDYTQTGVEWNKVGYANPVHSQHVAAPGAERAVLLPRLDRDRAGSSRSRGSSPRRSRTAPLAVLASNITWNAYNNFGGRSNYIHADGLPPTPTVNSRAGAEALHRRRVLHLGRRRLRRRCRSTGPSRSTTSTSTRRSPTRSRAGRRATSPRPSGGCSAGWNARASPTTTTPRRSSTTARSTCRSTACWCSAVHPEYWTRRMYDRVKRWVFEEGGRLMYLGGNGLNCEVELRPDDAMVCPQRQAHGPVADGHGRAREPVRACGTNRRRTCSASSSRRPGR